MTYSSHSPAKNEVAIMLNNIVLFSLKPFAIIGSQRDNLIISTLGNPTEASYLRLELPARSVNNTSDAYADDFSIEIIN